MTLLEVQGLDKRFGGVVAAKSVAFTVDAGELVAMIGPNGAGKSTTFNMVGGQVVPDRGTIVFNGQSIAGLSPRAVWARGVARTFQIAQTFVSMTVAENVQVALQSWRGQSLNAWSLAHHLARDEALDLLELAGMRAAADRAVNTLAYGDVKRVELAIALATQPKLLLMDEPTAGMAPREREALMALVAKLAREQSVGVLFTEHDMDSVFGHANRILVLVRGEIVARGTPAEIRANALVRQVYLGELGAEVAAGARRG